MLVDFETTYLRFLRAKDRAPWGSILFACLAFLSLFYLAGLYFRKALYLSGVLRKKKLPCPVVSVGNITAGGAGKTPLVIHLARYFVSKGRKVAVLSRGHGRRDPAALVWVSDGQTLLASPGEGGDEPVLIAQSVPKAAVVVCKDRFRAGQEVLARFKPDLILLDDGFQRRFSLHRDLEILVLDGADPFSTGHVLPAGLLREPLSELSQADILVLNKVDLCPEPGKVHSTLQALSPRALRVESRYRVGGFRDLRTGRSVRASNLSKIPVGAISGLADPAYFLRLLEGQRIQARHSYVFPDHFVYTKENLRDILEDAKLRGLKALVTTRKDAVKFPKDLKFPFQVLALEIEWEMARGGREMEKRLKEIAHS